MASPISWPNQHVVLKTTKGVGFYFPSRLPVERSMSKRYKTSSSLVETIPAEISKLATAISVVHSVASTATKLYRTSNNLLPPEFQFHGHVISAIKSLLPRSITITMVIRKHDSRYDTNEIYEAAEIYLGMKDNPKVRRLEISKHEDEKHFNITIGNNQVIPDSYCGRNFEWVRRCEQTKGICYFEFTFNEKDRDLVINSYLPYIIKEARNKKLQKRAIKIFTVDYQGFEYWTPVNFDHPASFETLAMDSDQKMMILEDLDKFVGRKDYYRKMGKAWKRGYLLYGPPGTGKSTMIAAMANYLNFDVYDLELTQVKHNSQLRSLLMGTGNKSILVIEDIDCTIDMEKLLANRDDSGKYQKGESKVTLSGLLNFVDGLWSSCGDERIIIFTTNHVEKLDPALLRPGRMDMHINLSYCTPCGFRVLASNYLGIEEHALFGEIESLIGEAKVTPAEVTEEFLKNGDDPEVALRGLIGFIRNKTNKNELEEKKETKTSKNEPEEKEDTKEKKRQKKMNNV